MANLKKLSEKEELFVGGHRMCMGCGIPIILRSVLMARQTYVIAASATGCLEVASSIYPYTSWNMPWIHSAFENAAATISGLESMYKALSQKGKIKKEIKFLAVAGDGGTYDIGLQSLSGAIERGHDFVYLCYNNEAYMNTGYQRSSATPAGAFTSTTPVGSKIKGKIQKRKNLSAIIEAHDVPYLAQATPGYYNDLINKAKKAFEIEGPTFLNVLQPCIPGWKIAPHATMELAKSAVDTAYWPSYEVEDGKLKITVKPKIKKPLSEFLKHQGRFTHLLRLENKSLLNNLQSQIDKDWQKLLEREERDQAVKAA